MSNTRSILLQGGALVAFVGSGILLALFYRPALASIDGAPAAGRVSVMTDGTEGDGVSAFPAVSEHGQYVVFASSASNLVAGDTNGVGDVFVKDRTNGAIVCVSVSTGGSPAAGESYAASLSDDGQRVAFVSDGGNLIDGDSNELPDVFVRDLVAHTTSRVSVSQSGQEADGRSSAPRISGDGHCVAFVSVATNLVAGDTNAEPDVFVRDLQAATLELISVGATGEPADGPSDGPIVSADGRYVAFASTALNLIPGEDGTGAARVWDVYRRDRMNGAVIRVSASLTGGRGDGHSFAPAMSADGRYVAFASHATNLVSSDLNASPDIFVRDLQAGITQRVSIGIGGLEPTGESGRPSMSADGRFVAFESGAGNLVSVPRPEGTTWIYLRDLAGGITTRVVAACGDDVPEAGTISAAISGDGHWIVFSSAEADLVSCDTNQCEDVFVYGAIQ